ncbi:prothymosin alpha-like [Sturnira hondurensis]|uniref:prothymosin alpha-like n=1 Tax=Sturnira hondurensis TaxID=192404 RepID=UPI00187A255C|nr:prothymosin alpha-like [Sturnira hondurensis]
MSDAAMDVSSEITTKDLKEKDGLEEAENGRDALANRNAGEENGEQKANNMVDGEEKGGGEEEEGEEEEGVGEEEDEDEVAKAAKGKRAAKDDENDDADTKKQKTDKDECTAKNEKLNLKKKKDCHDPCTLCFSSQNPWSRVPSALAAGSTGSPAPNPTTARICNKGSFMNTELCLPLGIPEPGQYGAKGK